jgi:hypothetical protein
MGTGRISDRRSRRAGVGAAAYFLLTGIIFATWASRVPAIKGGLDLGDVLGSPSGFLLGGRARRPLRFLAVFCKTRAGA